MIKNKKEYRQAFEKIDILLSEMGDDIEKQKEARSLAEEIQAYEKDHVSFPAPTTLLRNMKKWLNSFGETHTEAEVNAILDEI